MPSPNLALIGTGYWGKNLARNFHALGALHTLCDSNLEMLQRFSHYEDVACVTDYDAVLTNENISRVAIATPAGTHHELAVKAIEAGKDVYVEKPLCLTEDQAQDLVQFAESRQRILMVGHLLHYHPCIQKIKAMVADGELGKLFYLTSNRLNLGKFRREENSLWSFAPHDISVILSLAGEMPDKVHCSGDSFLTDGVADTTLTQLSFPSGIRSHVYVSWLNPFKEQKLTVVGSKAMVVFDDTKEWAEKVTVYRDYLTWHHGNVPTPNKSDGEHLEIPESEPLRNECEHFLACCDQKTPPLTDGREGYRVLSVLHAAQRSLDDHHSVSASPEKLQPQRYQAHETAVIDEGAEVGRGSKIWHFSHLCKDSVVGANCSLGQNVFVAGGARLADNVKVQNNVSIYAGVTIESDVFLGPSCVFTNVSNPRSEVVRRNLYEPTVIRRGASIGANSTIVCGTTIGRYAFVAAGATVTRDVKDYELVRGVPAKHVGWMSRHGHPLNFAEGGVASCPESGLRYQLENEQVRCLDLAEDQAMPEPLRVGEQPYRVFKPQASRS